MSASCCIWVWLRIRKMDSDEARRKTLNDERQTRAVFRKKTVVYSARKTVLSPFLAAMSSGQNSANRDKNTNHVPGDVS